MSKRECNDSAPQGGCALSGQRFAAPSQAGSTQGSRCVASHQGHQQRQAPRRGLAALVYHGHERRTQRRSLRVPIPDTRRRPIEGATCSPHDGGVQRPCGTQHGFLCLPLAETNSKLSAATVSVSSAMTTLPSKEAVVIVLDVGTSMTDVDPLVVAKLTTDLGQYNSVGECR